jgi:CBS domain-containing protein
MTCYLRNWTVHDLLHDEHGKKNDFNQIAKSSETVFHLEYIDDEDTVYTALQRMKAKNISSLPVRDQKTNHFIGILDVVRSSNCDILVISI